MIPLLASLRPRRRELALRRRLNRAQAELAVARARERRSYGFERSTAALEVARAQAAVETLVWVQEALL